MIVRFGRADEHEIVLHSDGTLSVGPQTTREDLEVAFQEGREGEVTSMVIWLALRDTGL